MTRTVNVIWQYLPLHSLLVNGMLSSSSVWCEWTVHQVGDRSSSVWCEWTVHQVGDRSAVKESVEQRCQRLQHELRELADDVNRTKVLF